MEKLGKVLLFALISVLFFSGKSIAQSPTSDGSSKEKEMPPFVGSGHCKMCHKEWYKSWAQTRMSDCYNLLRPGIRFDEKVAKGLDPDIDYRKDDRCLPCHTVGYNKPGGYNKELPLRYAKEKGLLGVGCEMCHGPGGHFWKLMPKFKKGMVREKDLIEAGLNLPGRTDKGDICMENCHNPKNPFHRTFDFRERVNRVSKKGQRAIHEHFELKALKYFDGKHDVDKKIDVDYVFRSREGLSDEFLRKYYPATIE